MLDTLRFQRGFQRLGPAAGLAGTVIAMFYSFTKISRGSTCPTILEIVLLGPAVTSVILLIGSAWLWITCRHNSSGHS